MKKGFKKSILIIMALLLALSSFAGCAGKDVDTETDTSIEDSVTPVQEGLPKNGYKYDPPVTLNVARAVGADVKFKNGETMEDNVHGRWALDTLGIKINYMWTTPAINNAFQTKLLLTMAANQPMPDFLTCYTQESFDLINSGKFQPVGDLFEKYAGEKWKAALAEIPNSWLPYTWEGIKFGIPQPNYTNQNDDVMWIRQDWLDKLGLKAPTTIAEMETVMDAFVNQDPDGNKQKDTVGCAIAFKENYTAWIGPSPLFGAFGALPQRWQKDTKGDIVYGSVRPEVKTALGVFKTWIDKGYFHKEIGLHAETEAYQLFTSGKAGITFADTWAYSWPLNGVETTIPGAIVGSYPLPAGPDGKIGQAGSGESNTVILISKDMKDPEIVFTYFNYLYDFFMDPEVGGEFEFGFAKGYDWDMVDGKIVTSDKEIPGGRADPQKYLLGAPPRTPSMYINTMAAAADGKAVDRPAQKRLVGTAKPVSLNACKVVLSQKQYIVENLFTGKNTPTMLEKSDALRKMEVTKFGEILYGKAPLDDFDTFVKDWYAQGGQKITDEVKDWYKSVGGK